MNAWGTCHQVREKNDMNLLYFFPNCLQVKKEFRVQSLEIHCNCVCTGWSQLKLGAPPQPT